MQLELPDFDTLKHMAETDPEGLEELRQKHVTALIDSAPAKLRPRLQGLQFQVDAQRRIHHASPMASCIKISQMMYDSFTQMRYLLNGIVGEELPRVKQPAAADAQPAKVIQFRGR